MSDNLDDSLKRRLRDAQMICQDIDDKEAICLIVGIETEVLRLDCCDTCRYELLQKMGATAAREMMDRYLNQRDSNARRH